MPEPMWRDRDGSRPLIQQLRFRIGEYLIHHFALRRVTIRGQRSSDVRHLSVWITHDWPIDLFRFLLLVRNWIKRIRRRIKQTATVFNKKRKKKKAIGNSSMPCARQWLGWSRKERETPLTKIEKFASAPAWALREGWWWRSSKSECLRHSTPIRPVKHQILTQKSASRMLRPR